MKHFLVCGTAVILLVLALASCSGADNGTGGEPPPAPAASGISGLVLIGPLCPGPEREDMPCPDEPFETDLLIRPPESEQETIRVRSGQDGRFRVELPPGDYTLEPATTGGPPFAGPVEVSVTPGELTEVTITFDSGIR